MYFTDDGRSCVPNVKEFSALNKTFLFLIVLPLYLASGGVGTNLLGSKPQPIDDL